MYILHYEKDLSS